MASNFPEGIEAATGCGAERKSVNPFEESLRKIGQEIDRLVIQGYEIDAGEYRDPAYSNPEKISQIFNELADRGARFEQARQKSKLQRAKIYFGAIISTDGWRWAKKRRQVHRQIKQQENEIRKELLYGRGAGLTDAEPWLEQCGRSTALLTIAVASQLQVAGKEELGGEYPTMSGPVDEKVLDYQFSEEGDFEGLNLREAMIKSEIDFSGKTQEEAARRADFRLAKLQEFLTAPVSHQFKDVVEHCVDSLGIRERKAEVNRVIADHINKLADSGKLIDEMMLLSFGCGTALPVLEAMAELKSNRGCSPKIILVDQDPLALAAAARLAEKMNLSDEIEIHPKRLFSKRGQPLNIDNILCGRSLDVVEDSGLREYLPDFVYQKLTEAAWKGLNEGGLMVTGNMNKNRPQPEFLRGLMGWPIEVIMRSIGDGFRLHESAGIEKGKTKAIVTQSGVYSIFVSQKS